MGQWEMERERERESEWSSPIPKEGSPSFCHASKSTGHFLPLKSMDWKRERERRWKHTERKRRWKHTERKRRRKEKMKHKGIGHRQSTEVNLCSSLSLSSFYPRTVFTRKISLQVEEIWSSKCPMTSTQKVCVESRKKKCRREKGKKRVFPFSFVFFFHREY